MTIYVTGDLKNIQWVINLQTTISLQDFCAP